MSRKRGRITVQEQPTRETRTFQRLAMIPFLVVSLFFVTIGITELIPAAGLFGLVWTFMAGCFVILAIFQMVRKNGVVHRVGYDVESDLDKSIVGLMEDVAESEIGENSPAPAGTTEARLLELLAQAENMSDLLEIEARLTDVRYELESVTSQLLVLANKVDYATVRLYISQVKEYTEVEEQTVWQRIATGFKSNLKDLGEGLVDFFVWLVTYSPQLVLAVVLIAGGSFLLRRVKKGKCNCRKGKKTPETKEEDK